VAASSALYEASVKAAPTRFLCILPTGPQELLRPGMTGERGWGSPALRESTSVEAREPSCL
jgi:hypothetical protein